MVSQRNRITEIETYLKQLGITVNIGKTKARGNRGFFQGNRKKQFRIDVAKDLSEDSVFSVLTHEFAHYIHYCHDSRLESLEFILGPLNEEIYEELLSVTVDNIPKAAASSLYEQKDKLAKEIKALSKLIKTSYPDFKLSTPYKKLEKSLKYPVKYLLKYDKISFFNRIYSIEHIENDFSYLTPTQIAYIMLKSKQRKIGRINSRISKLNKYYNRPSELFARFMELYILDHNKALKLAPSTSTLVQKTIRENKIPELTQYIKILSNVDFE